MLNWSQQFSILLFLDSNEYSTAHSTYEFLLGVADNPHTIARSLGELKQAHMHHPDWMLGHIAYDYKNTLEPRLQSTHKPFIHFPDCYFFSPDTICYQSGETLTIETTGNADHIWQAIQQCSAAAPQFHPTDPGFTAYMNRQEYIDTVSKLREHIAAGDCYEINFCSGACATGVTLNPLALFSAVNKLSPTPFAAYYRLHDKHMICASPERYLTAQNGRLISQPIKGTSPRYVDSEQDDQSKQNLRNSIKEQAENVMITDLVRNDLAHCCVPGSIHVDELFGIYSFPRVHQMISTISGTLAPQHHFTDALTHSFPMGSMTGAPKYIVMQLIDKYERMRRELFSGTVGYITPTGNFDFNVIIRSLFYNSSLQHLAYMSGGAITWDSDPQSEWEEMQLKAWAMQRVFSI